jgi:hypothetical protein
MEVDFIEFEDQDSDLSYCEGDPKLEDIDWAEVSRLEKLKQKVDTHPDEAYRDLASVCLLDEMYGTELDVR